jgi:hypothetical protein
MYNTIIPQSWVNYNPIIEISLIPMYTALGLSVYVIANATGIETLGAIVYLICGGYMYSKAIEHIYGEP